MRGILKFILGWAPAIALTLVIASTSWAMTAREFYLSALSYPSVNPFGATVHCAIETGNWRSRLWVEGLNGAGIKTSRAWRLLGMPSIETRSFEDEGGEMRLRQASFRKYRTFDGFMRDYSRKIRDDYPLSCRYYKNVWGYLDGLYKGKHGKWATDHRYFEILTAKSVELAPQIYGFNWRDKLARQLEIAKGFRILADWQIELVEKRLGL